MPSIQFDVLTLAVVGMVGVLAGLADLLLVLARRTPAWAKSLALAGVLGLLGAAGFVSGQPEYLWQPPLLVMLAQLALALLRAPRPRLERALPTIQAFGLMLLGGAVLGSQLYRIDQNLANEIGLTDQALAGLADPIDTNAPPVAIAHTDSSAPVPVYAAQLTSNSSEHEANYLREQGLQLKLIRTAPADPKTNCHGWVFTGGRYWVRGQHVDSILKDNGYRAVDRPAPGDLALFRNAQGEVTHTGVVRATEADGPVLIESKWGRMGRFIHTADEHAYRGQNLTYYHTDRGNHLLRDSDPSTSRATEPVVHREVAR